jgi:hypothetical protein
MTYSSKYLNPFQSHFKNKKLEKEMHQTFLWKRFTLLEKIGNVNSLALKLQSSPQQ